MTRTAMKRIMEAGLEQAWSALLADSMLQVKFLQWMSERFHRLWKGNPRMVAIAGYMKRAADDMELRRPSQEADEQEYSEEHFSSDGAVDVIIAVTEDAT